MSRPYLRGADRQDKFTLSVWLKKKPLLCKSTEVQILHANQIITKELLYASFLRHRCTGWRGWRNINIAVLKIYVGTFSRGDGLASETETSALLSLSSTWKPCLKRS